LQSDSNTVIKHDRRPSLLARERKGKGKSSRNAREHDEDEDGDYEDDDGDDSHGQILYGMRTVLVLEDQQSAVSLSRTAMQRIRRAAGNQIVLKPSRLSPSSKSYLRRIWKVFCKHQGTRSTRMIGSPVCCLKENWLLSLTTFC
jgi:hypothetical protein